jgi:uncharacterized membrane protein YtjA (UPF0391 family)
MLKLALFFLVVSVVAGFPGCCGLSRAAWSSRGSSPR